MFILNRLWKWLLIALGLLVVTGAVAFFVFQPRFDAVSTKQQPPGTAGEVAWGKDPGLGVRTLQKAGYTGKGVAVAYIDLPIHLSHEQYDSADIHYDKVWTDDPGMKQSASSMHGPGVVSLLLGKEIGIAPEVTLYYVGHPAWRRDQRSHAEAIRKVIEQNKSLPEGKQIRVLGFSDAIDSREANPEEFRKAVNEAEAAGIIVLLVDMPDLRLGAAAIPSLKEKERPENWVRDEWYKSTGTSETLWVPTGGRTLATGTPRPEPDAYRFDRTGGMSWAMPYLLGTIALGLQEDPTLTRAEIIQYLHESGHPFQDGNGKLINPPGFVELVKRNK